VPQLAALLTLGLDPRQVHWLDIPYTSHEEVRIHARDVLGVPDRNLARHRYRVLAPYAPYQLSRAIDAVLEIAREGNGTLLVLDDGAYAIEALAGLGPHRWPRRIVIVEQTTRGLIKLRNNASMRRVAGLLPVVNVAGSPPKRLLEPPFIAMAICSALKPRLDQLFAQGRRSHCLVLGYGAIGEQVAHWVRKSFGLEYAQVHVYDPDPAKQDKARERKYAFWDRANLVPQFRLVIGCSGEASFSMGDSVYLEDGALLVSASSGSEELSRQSFIELADVSDLDDVQVARGGLDEGNIHADLRIRLVDRQVTFANAGFPVNFDGRLATIPTEFMQPTATMMVAAAVQAIETEKPGLHDLDPSFCVWIDQRFRTFLGPDVHWLMPPSQEAW
jgi:hypothetical protein